MLCTILFVRSVFMKDVSRQTMEDLIAYIYTGEVTVNQEQLANLLETGKSLDINGLMDEHNPVAFGQKQSNQCTSFKGHQRPSNGHQSKPQMEYPSTSSNGYKRNIVEYRSTQTNPINKSTPHTNGNGDDILIEVKPESSAVVCSQPLLLNEENFDIVEYSLADGPIHGNSNNSDENNFDEALLEFLMNNDSTLPGFCDRQKNEGKTAGTKSKAPEDVDGPKRKRAAKRKFGM